LPWTVLLPLVLKTKWATASERNLARALSWGAGLPFLLVNLLPGGLPRYSMPSLVPACWLMAMTLSAPDVQWRGKVMDAVKRRRFVIGTAIVASVLLCVYGSGVVPLLQKRAKIKPIAAKIDRLIPKGETLYALDPSYQPFLFYVRSHLVYVSRLNDLPADARYLLIQAEREPELMESERWLPRRPEPIGRVTDYRNRTVILARVGVP
jgi:hypothetical protein